MCSSWSNYKYFYTVIHRKSYKSPVRRHQLFLLTLFVIFFCSFRKFPTYYLQLRHDCVIPCSLQFIIIYNAVVLRYRTVVGWIKKTASYISTVLCVIILIRILSASITTQKAFGNFNLHTKINKWFKYSKVYYVINHH